MSSRIKAKIRETPNRSSMFVIAILLLFLYFSKLQSDRCQGLKKLEELQDEIINKTAYWRGLRDICYKGYCGPWIEEYYYEYFIKTKPTSDRLYLPISWTNCHIHCTKEDKEALREFVRNLNPKFKYYSVVQIARGLQHHALRVSIPENIDMLLFSAGGYTLSKKTVNVPIPLLKRPLQTNFETKKNLLGSFVGSLATHPLRKELQKRYSNFFVFGNLTEWETVMETSFFSLCPRGFGPSSFRMFEALQLESVPIYVWDEEIILPFSDIIDWNKISVIVHQADIDKIPMYILERNYTEYITEIRRIKHYFSYTFTAEYINRIVRAR